MNPDDFRAALARVGLTQASAARLFGISSVRIRRMATGEVEVPNSVRVLLIVMERVPLTPSEVAEMVEEK